LGHEVLVKARHLRLSTGRSGTAVRARGGLVELEGVAPTLAEQILDAIDGRATVDHILAETPAGTRDLLERLVRLRLWSAPLDAGEARPKLIVVDDFLDDAAFRRREALRARYRAVPWFLFPGKYSEEEPVNVAAVMAKLEKLIGSKLYWGHGPIHG